MLTEDVDVDKKFSSITFRGKQCWDVRSLVQAHRLNYFFRFKTILWKHLSCRLGDVPIQDAFCVHIGSWAGRSLIMDPSSMTA